MSNEKLTAKVDEASHHLHVAIGFAEACAKSGTLQGRADELLALLRTAGEAASQAVSLSHKAEIAEILAVLSPYD
jgi:hypothetical protein